MWLVNEGYHVSVVGRSTERLKHLKSLVQDSSLITPISVDYHQQYAFQEEIRQAVKNDGPIELAVAWIHSPTKEAIDTIVREAAIPQPWRLFHVIGSRAKAGKLRTQLQLDSTCRYHQVQLGFVLEGELSRWNTNEEISNGVIQAIMEDKPYHLVGVLEPEEKRP